MTRSMNIVIGTEKMNKICLQCKMEFTQTLMKRQFCDEICKKGYKKKYFKKFFSFKPDNTLVTIRQK